MTLPVEFRFNTGRLYQANGPWIRVSYAPDTGEATFADDSRMVDGVVQYKTWADHNALELKVLRDYVLNAYDHGAYKRNSASLDYLLRPPTPRDQIKEVK